ncbi:MAG: hypothetical protein J5760_03350, partial [Clostridia bacterium]|nr:hypothetical protein [Clostridia bacterium]
MRKLKKILSVILVSALLASLGLGCLNVSVFAEDVNTYTLKELVDNDQIKILGRTRMNGNNLVCEWVATGFDINITVPEGGTTFTVYTDVTLSMYADIIVDGDVEGRTRAPASTTARSLSKEIPAGKHQIRVLRDSGPDKTDLTYHYEFEAISFAGTIDEKPADKELFIEYIGASGQLGSGALQRLVPGVGGKSGPAYSSGVYSNAYVSAADLDADFSIVAMGGYGLISAASQEVINGEVNMRDLYPYIGGERDYYNAQAGEDVVEWDFPRKADLVVSVLGSNDGEARMADWEAALREMLDTIAEKYGPETPVLWATSPSRGKQLAVLERFQAEYPNLYIYLYAAGGNGGNALATQTRNHS